MNKLTIFVILTLSFNAAFMVQAYAQNVTTTASTPPVAVVPVDPDATANAYTALITSIGTLVGTIGSIIGVFVVFIRDVKTKELAQKVGLGMEVFGQKTVENTDRIRNLTKATYILAPQEAKDFLNQNKMKVEQLTESVNKGTEQLQVIKDNLPGDATAKINTLKKDLPVESYDTRPTV